MKIEYEFIVFNDAKDFSDNTNGGNLELKQQIRETCQKFDIKCIDIPNEEHKNIHCPVKRCSDSMNYILEYQKQNPDRYLIIDSDMFLIDYLYDNDLELYDALVVLQTRENYINYVWNGLVYIDFNKIKNVELLDWTKYPCTDVGGENE